MSIKYKYTGLINQRGLNGWNTNGEVEATGNESQVTAGVDGHLLLYEHDISSNMGYIKCHIWEEPT